MVKPKSGRFDGLTEEQVKEKDALPDYLEPDLDIVFLGINPSLMAAHKGRYYAGPGNHFYKLLHAAKLVPRFVNFEEDSQLLQYKIGLTNIVDRATRSSADLTKAELNEGCKVVTKKMIKYKPKIAVFNGKCIYQVFAKQIGKTKYDFGLQDEKIGNTTIYVVPSSSARCSNFPRLNDKLPFFLEIKKHLQFLKGEIIDESKNYFHGKGNQITDSSCTDPEKDFFQFSVMEILDGSQNNYRVKLDSDGVHSEKNSPVCSKEVSKDQTSSQIINFKSSKRGVFNDKDIQQVSEEQKRKKLNFSNILKNKGSF